MTAQDLKNAILQLAVQGKLVPQDPADEPASELLKRVCVKKKPMPIDRDTMPFDIPDSWQWSYISAVGELMRGSGIKRNETVDKGFPCVRYGELYTTYETSFTETASFIPESIFKYCKQITYGDLLITLTGENKPDIAKTIAYIGTTPVAVGGDLAYWTKHGMNPIYLSYLMASPYAIERKVELATGNMVVHISGVKLGTIPIPIPPLAEQARIVAKIEELLPYIQEYDAAEKRLTALDMKFPDQLRKSILQQAIMGKLTERNPADEPASELLKRIQTEKTRLIKEGKLKKEKPLPPITEDEIPFDIPVGWEWVRFGNIVEAIGDGIHGTPQYDSAGDYYFINGNNLVDGTIVLKEDTKKVSEEEYLKHRKPLNSNTVLLSINGTIGNIAFYQNEPVILGKSACYIALPSEISKEYIRIMLGTKLFLNYAVGKATKTTIANVSLKAMRMFPVPLPPLSEQKRIVGRVEELLAVCGQLKLV